LTIHENGQTLTYSVTGNVAGDVLTLSSDNKGGTDIYLVPPQERWISCLSGGWSAASDWVSGGVASSADDAVINNSSAVTVNGAAVAHSLGLNNSDLTISGSLSLGTSLTIDGSTLSIQGGSVSAQSIISDSGGQIVGYGTVDGAINGGINLF